MPKGRHAFDHAIHQIRANYGLDLTPDAEGAVSIKFDQGVTCTLECPAESDFLFFHAPVDRAPQEDRQQLLRYLLQANVFGLPVPCAWIGMDAATEEVLLCAGLPLESITAEQIEKMLSAFVASVPDLRRALHEGEEADAPVSPEDEWGRDIDRLEFGQAMRL